MATVQNKKKKGANSFDLLQNNAALGSAISVSSTVTIQKKDSRFATFKNPVRCDLGHAKSCDVLVNYLTDKTKKENTMKFETLASVDNE